MKFIIKEGQIERMLFKYLDSQDFEQHKNIIHNETKTLRSAIYFFTPKGSETSVIRYNRWDGSLIIDTDLIDELLIAAGMEEDGENNVFIDLTISEWVEEKLNIKIPVYKIADVSSSSDIGGPVFDRFNNANKKI